MGLDIDVERVTEVLLPDGKWVRDEDDDGFAIMIHR